MFQAPRGTQDILPEDRPWWRYIEHTAEEVARLYDYGRIETPVFEESGLFVRTVGAGTDIVEKEMYSFTDLSGGQLTLRPEGTAPVCRAYLEHGMANLPQPVKLYYLAPIFRYERPQAGRYRQHHQFGFEAIGEAGAAVDAEVIDMAWRFFARLGLRDLTLELNSIGCPDCRPAYLEALRCYYTEHSSVLCVDCRVRLQKNTLRLLDCKQPTCGGLAERAPQSAAHLCTDCVAHFAELQNHLAKLALPFNINHRLVRGLDYYARTVFEIQPQVEGGQSTLGGGGRYDGLITELGGKPTPAVGFATGLERILLNLRRQGVAVPSVPGPAVYFAWFGEAARAESARLLAEARGAGIAALTAFSPRSFKAQLRQANTAGCRFAVIIGDDELAEGTAVVRDMPAARQEKVSIGQLVAKLQILLGRS